MPQSPRLPVTAVSPQRAVKRQRIHEEVSAFLLQDIQQGLYPVGSCLPSERALMDSFGVGRPAIRESLAKLARLGVIELKAGVRPRVRRPDVAPLLDEMKGAVQFMLAAEPGQRHMQEVRMMLEASLARYAAQHIKAEDLQSLWANIEAQSHNLHDMAAFAELDMVFHRIIANVPNNPVLLLFQTHLADWLFDIRVNSLKNPGQAYRALEAHKAVYQALCAKDPLAAEAAMEAHLEQVITSIVAFS